MLETTQRVQWCQYWIIAGMRVSLPPLANVPVLHAWMSCTRPKHTCASSVGTWVRARLVISLVKGTFREKLTWWMGHRLLSPSPLLLTPLDTTPGLDNELDDTSCFFFFSKVMRNRIPEYWRAPTWFSTTIRVLRYVLRSYMWWIGPVYRYYDQLLYSKNYILLEKTRPNSNKTRTSQMWETHKEMHQAYITFTNFHTDDTPPTATYLYLYNSFSHFVVMLAECHMWVVPCTCMYLL